MSFIFTDYLKTSVVILNWNGKHWLEKFVPVVKSSLGSDAELIVADNASEDDSISYMQAHFPDVRLILLDRNHGFAGGYNLAINQIDSEYCVLLNSDVEASGQWLEPLVTFMDANPEYAACQPKIRWFDQRDMFEYAGASGGFVDIHGYPFCRGRIFSTLERDHGQYDDITDVLWASGACLMIRTSDYQSAGGLDDRFFAHMEEIDLCWRLWNSGRKIAVVPSSTVFHVGGGSLPRTSARKTYLNFRNNLLLLHKNYPPALLNPVLRRRFWLDMIAWILFSIQGHFADARAVRKARRDFFKMRHLFQQSCSSQLPPVVFQDSILKHYHFKGKKHFNELHQIIFRKEL